MFDKVNNMCFVVITLFLDELQFDHFLSGEVDNLVLKFIINMCTHTLL